MEQAGCGCVRKQPYGVLQPRAARSRHATLSVKAQAEQPQHYDFFTRHVPLQGNEGNQAFWLLDPLQDIFFNVHGPDFIIQRPESFAQIFPKLRLRKLHERNLHIQTVPKPQPGACAMVKCDSSAHQVPVVFEGQQFVVDVTLLLEQVVEQPAAPYGIIPTVSPGLVHVPVELEQGEDGQEVFIGSSSSPRRTKMVGFTCLRCNARSYKPVNPLSFQEGTLVVQCGKCQCWHKIRDHLHLFHDMKGELFFRASPITHADVPEALRAPLDPFYWMEGLEGFDAENN